MITPTLMEHIRSIGDVEELDRLQAAIELRRRELSGDGTTRTSAGPAGAVLERRPYGSGVLQLEAQDANGPCWYFHLRKDGERKIVYVGRTDEPEIALAQIKGGMGG
ncbi:hypothetical protein GBA65_15190 [Rubrobacter marinus]|uniref:Uncharacterized protein n=1 Tax=Rubrobacter marinus TaxID=2653852 RepID=A0A6G8PZQ3_9ACTN|nr:hypothetical protein [Rubrobacter marinus]QIN79648.1 hypothetical protein GBA65_15190 [Rubrobacter marinus]